MPCWFVLSLQTTIKSAVPWLWFIAHRIADIIGCRVVTQNLDFVSQEVKGRKILHVFLLKLLVPTPTHNSWLRDCVTASYVAVCFQSYYRLGVIPEAVYWCKICHSRTRRTNKSCATALFLYSYPGYKIPTFLIYVISMGTAYKASVMMTRSPKY